MYTDIERGIIYRAKGNVRSVRGLFTDFNSYDTKQIEKKGIETHKDGTVTCNHIEDKRGVCRKCLDFLLGKKEKSEKKQKIKTGLETKPYTTSQ